MNPLNLPARPAVARFLAVHAAIHAAPAGRSRAARRPGWPRGLPWCCAALATPWLAPFAAAQTTGGVIVEPSLSVQETLTSNSGLSGSNPHAESITQLSPGVRVTSRGGRVQGSLAYALNALAYARDRSQSTLQNALDADLRAELVQNHVFVDAVANVSQRSISAFGTQSSDPALRNGNSSEVATASVRPRARGNLGGYAEVSAGAHWDVSRSDGTALGDSSSHGADLALSGGTGFIGWGVNARRDAYAFKTGRSTQTDTIGGSLTYVPRYDMRFGARAGTSRSDVLSGTSESEPTYGWSINWQPTDRTDIALTGDKTYYGDSHSYSLRHRMARSVWSYIDTKGVSGPPNGQPGQVLALTLYDLLFAICLSSGRDEPTCDRAVRADIAANNRDPRSVVGTLGFLNSSLTLQRTQVLAVSYAALRTTFTLTASRYDTRPLGPVGGAGGDLARGIAVRQQGITVGAAHQLTPASSLSAAISQQQTSDAGTQNGNRLRTVSIGWSLGLGPRTSLALSGRHSRFSGNASAYNESAVIGSLGARF